MEQCAFTSVVGYLRDKIGMEINGVILVSSVCRFVFEQELSTFALNKNAGKALTTKKNPNKMKSPNLWHTVLLVLIVVACNSSPMKIADVNTASKTNDLAQFAVARIEPSDYISIKPSAAIILSRKQVPILCYHQIRDWRPTDSKRAKDYIVPVNVFKEQMKMLVDNGFHTILPDQLYDYLVNGTALPEKPVMLTFDDTDLGQYTVAFPELKKYNFKAVYFIMTVSLNRPNYMSIAQVKELSDAGNVIGSHTWDHHNVKQYKQKDWEIQIDKPTRQLENITGKPIRYFAYPFGLWNPQAIPELEKRNFSAAFQLITKRDNESPLYTIRRMIVPGYWSLSTLRRSMNQNF